MRGAQNIQSNRVIKKLRKRIKGGQTAILVCWSAGLLVRCPADYRNVSGLEKIVDQRQRTTEIELPLVRCSII
jgi:hypothetical protein